MFVQQPEAVRGERGQVAVEPRHSGHGQVMVSGAVGGSGHCCGRATGFGSAGSGGISAIGSPRTFEIFGSELTAAELKGGLDGLETGRRGGPEPKAVIFADFGRAIPEA
ncbi:hypothetical protein ACFVFF_13520 [Streptomyces sp. NPDC057680]|uniref:hypothetical protein n=1 Tax=Streptomyces sp. NPDC057680 TaxID=3346208 RepID=UPI003673BCA8